MKHRPRSTLQPQSFSKIYVYIYIKYLTCFCSCFFFFLSHTEFNEKLVARWVRWLIFFLGFVWLLRTTTCNAGCFLSVYIYIHSTYTRVLSWFWFLFTMTLYNVVRPRTGSTLGRNLWCLGWVRVPEYLSSIVDECRPETYLYGDVGCVGGLFWCPPRR